MTGSSNYGKAAMGLISAVDTTHSTRGSSISTAKTSALVHSCCKFTPLGGTVTIHRLSPFPLACHYEVENIRETLITRGRVFEAYKGYHSKAYEGIAMGW